MPIDKELVRRKIKFIGEDFEKLKPIMTASYDELMAREIAQPALERYLERIIGRMIDINYHLVRELRHLPPKDYYESFKELGTLNVLSGADAVELARYAGLRNHLAHEYDEIDTRLLYEEAKKFLSELPVYLQAIESFIER